MAVPFLTGGFVSRVSAKRSSSLGSSASSVTGHSADCSEAEGSDDSTGECRRPPMVMGDAEPMVMGAAEKRQVGAYNSRDDVGSICILSGNWGGGRSNERVATHVNNDIKKGLGTILMLQEAQPSLMEVLRAPSVEGLPDTSDPLLRRASYKYDCISGGEEGNTLVIASRSNLTQSINLVQWTKRRDGSYREKQKTKIAITRLLVAHVVFHKPVSGHKSLTVCNVHFHHLTAKKDKGLANAHKTFWDELARVIRGCGVQVLAGDFNMSLFCVVPSLRARGLVVNVAAWFPWIKQSDGKVRVDSCGIFLVGGVTSVKCLCSWSCFEQHHGNAVTMKEESDSDDAASVQDVPAAVAAVPTIQQFCEGQGYECTSYLPRKQEEVLAAIKETLTFSVEDSSAQATLPERRPLPPAKQKACDSKIFDPDQLLFRTGVHMPLALFLGKYSRRTETAIERRCALRKDRHFKKQSDAASPIPKETNA